MKMILGMALFALSVSTFAASVKVTSFNYIRTSNDYYSPLAELCGVVDGATASPTFINAKIDPKSKNPGSYNTIADADGKFCLAVITFRGQADVTVMGEKEITTASIK